ncbi:MAG TPA: hypothetical protein VNA25_02775 [Phycisphaerae bacterium]|nr:hypothetical protein [Phycisphaerae bacterium]
MAQTKPTEASPAPARQRLPAWCIVLAAAALVAGLGGRLWLTSLAPRWAYVWDHFDNIQMGRTATKHGLFRVYDVEPRSMPQIPGYAYAEQAGGFIPYVRPGPRKVNYPPLGVTVFWLQSSLLRAVDPPGPNTIQAFKRERRELYPDPNYAPPEPPMLDDLTPVNTFTSRLVMSIAAVAAELVAAVGVFLIARMLAGPVWGLLAAVVCWLMPPLAMDSSFWGQTDAWFLAPAVFTIYMMLRGQRGLRPWVWAGALAAVTVLLKPHGLFLGPVVLFGAWVLPDRGRAPDWPVVFRRAGALIGAGAAALILISLPWSIASGGAWVQEGYVANFTKYGDTTLKAFNVWYLDVLLLDGTIFDSGGAPVFALDSKATIMGIPKDAWGRLLALAAMAVAAWLVGRKYRHKGPTALVLFSALWVWSTFMWPTRVHERYIVYAIPLVTLAAVLLRRLWPAVLALAIVGTAELCHNVWLNPPPGTLLDKLGVRRTYEQAMARYVQMGGRSSRYTAPTMEAAEKYEIDKAKHLRAEYLEQRKRTKGLEWLLLLISLGGYAWAFASPFAFSVSQAAADKPPPKPAKGHKPKRSRR